MKDKLTGADFEQDDDSLLNRVFEAFEHGESLDPEDLKNQYPDRCGEIDLYLKAVSKVISAENFMRSRAPGFSRLGQGTVLGDYEITELIASGGMGVVYSAKQHSLGGRVVALKVLPSENMNDHARERFQREALTAASLHHPNLAEVYGFGTTENHLFYAMRLVKGPTLMHVLQRVTAHPENLNSQKYRTALVRSLSDVASALEIIHDAGLVHHDVKPSNIIFEDAWRGDEIIPDKPAVLVDFGLVRPVDPESRTVTRTTSATPAYAAPEVLLGMEADARADVFSFGVTMHDLLSGTLPGARFQASSGLASLAELIPGYDKDLSGVVNKAVNPVKAWRYEDASGLNHDLQAWLSKKPVTARRLNIVEYVDHFRRRRPAMFSGVLLLLFSVALIFTLLSSKAIEWSTASTNLLKSIESGNLRELNSVYRSLESTFAKKYADFFFLDPSQEDFIASLYDTPTSPIYAINDLYMTGKKELALAETVHELIRSETDNGVTSSFLTNLLSHDLTSVDTYDSNNDDISFNLFQISRLFVHKPDDSPQDFISSENYRRMFRPLVGKVDQTLRDKLYIISALAGCGSYQDALEIFEFLKKEDNPSIVEQRLSINAISVIFSRAKLCGFIDDIKVDENSFLDLIDSALEILKKANIHLLDEKQNQQQEAAWLRFFESITAVSIAGDIHIGPLSLGTIKFSPQNEMVIRVLFGEKAFDDDIRRGVFPDFVIDDRRKKGVDEDKLELIPSYLWGLLCAYTRDSQIYETACKNCRNRPADDYILGIDSFETIYDRTVKILNGDLFHHYIDSIDESSISSGVLRYKRLDKPKDPNTYLSCHFGHDPIQIWGGIEQIDHVQTLYDPKGGNNDHRKFLIVGSELQIHFTIKDIDLSKRLTLHFEHLAADRPMMPFGGEVQLEISLDGWPITSFILDKVGFESMFAGINQIPISSEKLYDGNHTLKIRLAENSNTTYWLRKIWLEIEP